MKTPASRFTVKMKGFANSFFATYTLSNHLWHFYENLAIFWPIVRADDALGLRTFKAQRQDYAFMNFAKYSRV
jgi:hypothetical protein